MRDHMLAQYTKCSSASKSSDERDSLKCSLISSFASNLNQVMAVYSLRVETIRCYQSLLKILEDFPAAREAHFIVGDSRSHDPTRFGFMAQYAMHSSGKLLAAEMHRSRPHQLITRDGRFLLNLWYIPHFTEVYMHMHVTCSMHMHVTCSMHMHVPCNMHMHVACNMHVVCT